MTRFNSIGSVIGAASAAISLLPVASHAQTTWNTGNSGNWSLSSNWAPATVDGPSGVGAIVNLTRNIAGDRTVTLDLNRTVGILNIGDTDASGGYDVVGTNTLTLDNGASPSQINYLATAGSRNDITAHLALAGDLNITNLSTFENRLGGNISSVGDTRTITLTSSSSGTLHVTGLTNSGAVNFVNNAANGTLQFDNTARTFTGTITNNAGRLVAATGGNAAFGASTLVLNGGTLTTAGVSTRTISNNYAIGGDITLDAGGSSAMNLFGNGTLSGIRTVTVASTAGGVFIQAGTLSGSGGLIKDGAGLLTFGTPGSKTYTGGTVINSGTLRFASGSSNIFADAATAHFTVNNGSVLDVQANQALGVVTLNNGSIIGTSIVTASDYIVQSGSIAVRLQGAGADLVKNGVGTVFLGTSATYTGNTVVNAGTLVLEAAGSVASTTLGFGVSNTSSGVLQVENAGFSFSGGIELSLGSVSVGTGSWDLFTGSAFTTGDLALSSLTSDIIGLTFVESGGIWTGSEGSRTWSFDEGSGVLSVVPEPSTWALIALGLSTTLIFRKRRAGLRS